jgi:DNA-binding transcriptional MerR regulator
VLTVSELSERSGTPISSIKFYVREGLLPEADLDAPHRAFYDDGHVRRLRLIQALRKVAGLSLDRVRRLCRVLDAAPERGGTAKVVARVIDAVARGDSVRAVTLGELRAARRDVLAMLGEKGVRVRPGARAVTELAAALVHLRRTLDTDIAADAFLPYLDAMRALAERDVDANRHLVVDATSAAFGATIGTVLWEPVLVLLRRIAFEDVAARTFGAPPPASKRRTG